MIEFDSPEEARSYVPLRRSNGGIYWKDEQSLIKKCVKTLADNQELTSCFEIQSGEAVVEAVRQSDAKIKINVYLLYSIGEVNAS